VSGYTIDASTGALSPMATPTVAAGYFPFFITVDPTGRFAYVANDGSNDVSAYTIDARTGALSPMAAPTVAAGNYPQSMALSR
jgi:6-phosphogluconolactonase